MGAGGHIAQMITRMQENRKMLRKRPFLNVRKDYMYVAKNLKINLQEYDEEDLAKIRMQILKERKARDRRLIYYFVISLLISFILILLILGN